MGGTNRPPEIGHPGFSAMLQHAWQRSLGSISLLIVAMCAVLFVAVAVLDLFNVLSRREIIASLGLSYVGVFQRLWLYQFLTAPLLHGSLVHLLFNMLALWMLGPGVEETLGRARYIFFSALCAACSMIGFLVFNWGTGNICLGYSGVIFGLLVAQAIFFPNSVVAIFAFFPLKIKHAVLLLGAVELYLTIAEQGGGVAHAADLFGALAAFAYLQGTRWRKRLGTQKKEPSEGPSLPKPIRRRGRREVPREL